MKNVTFMLYFYLNQQKYVPLGYIYLSFELIKYYVKLERLSKLSKNAYNKNDLYNSK